MKFTPGSRSRHVRGRSVPTNSAQRAAELAGRFAPGALGYAETASLGQVFDSVRQSAYWTAVADSPQWKQATASPDTSFDVMSPNDGETPRPCATNCDIRSTISPS